MLGVDRVVLHGGVEPQPVALLAVIERALELGRAGPPPCASAARGRGAARLRGLLAVALLGGVLLASRLLLGRGLGRVELGGDQGIVLGAQIDLVVVVGPRVAVVAEVVVAPEGLDLLDRDLELVRDPGVGPSLPDPGPDLVELRVAATVVPWARRSLVHAGGCTRDGAGMSR